MDFLQATERQSTRVRWALLAVMLLAFGAVLLTSALQVRMWTGNWPADVLASLLTSPWAVTLAMLAVITLGVGAYHRMWLLYRLNQDLLTRLQKQYRIVLRFSELSHHMVVDAELERLLALVLEHAMDVCDGETGSVMLLDESSQVLRIKAAHGLSSEVIEETALPLGEGIAGLVAKRGKPAVLGSSTADPDLVPLMKRQDRIQTAVSAPIMLKGRVLGTVNVNRVSRGTDYDEHDANALCAFAAQAALAIEKARLLWGKQAAPDREPMAASRPPKEQCPSQGT